MSAMSFREGRRSIPSTISHSCASKYKLPPRHQIWTLPAWHFTSGRNMISLLFCTKNACGGQARGTGLVKIEPWSWGPSVASMKSPVSLGEQVQGCDESLSSICQWRLEKPLWPEDRGTGTLHSGGQIR